MKKTIAIFDGHPHRDPSHFVHALADAYETGARQAGHKVMRINVAAVDFQLLCDPAAWREPAAPTLKPAQKAIKAADHLVFAYPLWMGSMPALLKGFLEQLTAGGFAVEPASGGEKWVQKLKGKSARIIVTMGMPAPVYRYYFGAHSLKSFEQNILRFAGVGPVRDTLIGMVESRSAASRKRALARIEKLGAAAR